MMNIVDGLTFDDVLLIPEHSDISSRSEDNINTGVNLGKGITLPGPFISANMKTITGPELATEMYSYGLGILHRFDSLDNQIENFKTTKSLVGYAIGLPSVGGGDYCAGVSVGVNSKDDADFLIDSTEAKIVCIDVAHGDHAKTIAMTKHISTKYPNVLLIAGNVATGDGARRLAGSGADVIKVGVGPGSLCTTRVETGNGVPQLTALYDVYNSLFNVRTGYDKIKIIADGGIKHPGDVVKALCFSHAVMLGSVLAGTEETPGEVFTLNDQKWKKYAGSSTHKTSRIEGVEGLVPYKGPVKNVLRRFKEGLVSGMSYQGVRTLDELRENPRFVRITSAGLRESHAHAMLFNG